MSIFDHLGELRRRLIVLALTLIVFVCVCCLFVEHVVQRMVDLGTYFDFIYLAPTELIGCYFRIVLIMALVLSSPMIFYHLWAFVRPALVAAEKKAVAFGLVGGLLFFMAGVLFAYYIALPFMLAFFYNFNSIRNITASISFEKYMDFLISTFLSFGLMFELPMVTLLLAKLGVLHAVLMIKLRKYAVLLIFIISAFITPPDVSSQILMAVPMMLLYELSILLCRLADRHKTAKT